MANILIIIIIVSIGILFSFLRKLHFQKFIYLNTNLDSKDKLVRIRGNAQKELYLHLIRGSFTNTNLKKNFDGNKLIITFYMSNLSERIYRLQTPFGAPIYYFHNENVWIRGRRLSSVKYLDKALLSIDGDIFKRKKKSTKIENMFHY